MPQPLLEIRNATKVYGGGFLHKGEKTIALDNYNLTVSGSPPTITTIAGESGSGKTTLANAVLGFTSLTSGQILFKGRDVSTLKGRQLLEYRRDVQAIFQDPFEVYNPFYKVDHVLAAPIRHFGLAKGRQERRELMEEALRAVGLRVEETLGRYPHQLSGGQRQRTMVARTLLLRPKVIVADEPVSMVDASLRVTVLTNLLQLKEQFGISLIYITHDLATAYQISDRVIVLHRGEVVEEGDPEQVVKHPEHPYTKLLIGSIPLPDPSRSWGDTLPDGEGSLEALETQVVSGEALVESR